MFKRTRDLFRIIVRTPVEEKPAGGERGVAVDKKSYLWLYLIVLLFVVSICSRVQELVSPSEEQKVDLRSVREVRELDRELTFIGVMGRLIDSLDAAAARVDSLSVRPDDDK